MGGEGDPAVRDLTLCAKGRCSPPPGCRPLFPECLWAMPGGFFSAIQFPKGAVFLHKGYEGSKARYQEAVRLIPGGVNSPVRAFRSVEMNPVYIERGEGSRVFDVDGNEYIDYLCSWGPLILGHAHPKVVEAVQETARRGTSFGLPTELETEMAREVVQRVPSVEVVRMVNSGTEATMSALRLARAYTRRDKILKFEGVITACRQPADQRRGHVWPH